MVRFASGFLVTLVVVLGSGCAKFRAPASSSGPRLAPGPQSASYDYDEEFAGPFPSWKSVRDFGAKGDGVADDTDAIQRALDELKTVAQNDWSVLYFPAGTYRITKTLVTRRAQHREYLGGSIVGADPANTLLRWDGAEGQDMFHYDAWYTKVSRLTFDGASKAAVGLYRGDSFSTFCELSDLVFRDLEVGIQLGGGLNGGANGGQAEHAILRCKFYRCARYGIHTADWNSLDVWVWYSLFEDCGFAVFNSVGNYHAWKNVFVRSKEGDLGSANLSQFSFVGNTSVDSGTFTNWGSYHSNGAQVLIQGNRIYEPHNTSILTGSAGPFVILDNVIRDRSGFAGPSIWLDANDQFVMGNTVTLDEATSIKSNLSSWRGRERTTVRDTHVVMRDAIAPPDLTLPPTPPLRRRKVFEVPASSADCTDLLQSQIYAAARQPGGSHSVVHLAKGLIRVSRTLIIPANSEFVLLGDGAADTATQLVWTGQGVGPVLLMEGPSRATVRDLSIQAGAADAITVTKVDQRGGRLYADQLNIHGGATRAIAAKYGVRVEGVENADVTFTGLAVQGAETNVSVRGGRQREARGHALGQVSVLTGASCNSGILYDVDHGGELVAVAVWYEGNWMPTTRIDLHSSGSLTLASMLFATPASLEQPLFKVREHSGNFALVASSMSGAGPVPSHRFELSGKNVNVLSLGNSSRVTGSHPVAARSIWVDRTQAPAQSGLFHNHQYGDFDKPYGTVTKNFAFTEDEWRNKQEIAEAAFVREALRPLRNLRIEPAHRRAQGVTSVQLHRVLIQVGAGRTALALRR